MKLLTSVLAAQIAAGGGTPFSVERLDPTGLSITACTHVFKLRMKIAGIRPGQRSAR